MKIIILGAGLAGLSAGRELSKSGLDVVILEKESIVGGLAKSFIHNGYTCDLGGHRFFTKNYKLVSILSEILKDNLTTMPRKSSIYMQGKFLDYPPKLWKTLIMLSPMTSIHIVIDYITAVSSSKVHRTIDNSFEDWVKNRFGKTMYDIYFGPYTEKAWGTHPSKISSDWAVQRVTVISLWDAIKNIFTKKKVPRTYAREFYYPKDGGIGEISNRLSKEITENGGKIYLNIEITQVQVDTTENKISSIIYEDNGKEHDIIPDIVISTIPLTTLIKLMQSTVPSNVERDASKLRYKASIFIYLILNRAEFSENTWIYFPDKDILVNRVNELNKYSKNNAPKDKTLLCADITCDYNDKIWNSDDKKLAERCISDLERVKLLKGNEVEEYFVKRENYTYPFYDIGYKKNLSTVLTYLRNIKNLVCIGRNGLFQYNNMDHSLEIGIFTAKEIINGKQDGVGDIIKNISGREEYLG